MKSRLLSPTLTAAVFAIAASAAFGMFAQPSLAPVERLLTRAHAHLKENPKDADAHYTLGRIHYLAFYNRASGVAVYGQAGAEGLPSVAPYWSAEEGYLYQARRTEASARALTKLGVNTRAELPAEQAREFWRDVAATEQKLVKEGWKPDAVASGIANEHATLALRAFDKAIALDPQNPLYLLGKASLQEQALSFYAEQKPRPKRPDPKLSAVTPQQLRDSYFAAYRAGIDTALELKHRPVAGLRSIASYEAGAAVIRLSAGQELSPAEKQRVAKVEGSMEKLKQLRRGAITPVVFSLRPARELGDLLEPAGRARFDLDGDGAAEEWPWVRADTAFLVWDPARTGRILSGHQLFGSYTWQIPWENGYEPLALLDASGDGQLSGIELDGIRAWFDHDGDGISDPGEVVDLDQLEIRALATSGTAANPGSPPSNLRGITLHDGSSLPSWDWIPARAPQAVH